MPDADSRLLILGASARAAAFSALRADFTPTCGDLFADADLRRVCHAHAVESYPDGLEQVAHAAPGVAWMYTGALENHPDLVDRIAATQPLYGNVGATLRRVRDPRLLSDSLQPAGFQVPEYCTAAQALPTDGSWLHKRRRSAGGLHVSRWRGCPPRAGREEGWYFQRYIPGESCAAVYVSIGGEARFLGATEQLLVDEFRYAGSIGPLHLDAPTTASLRRLGDTLARTFGLVGVWGVDFVRNEQGMWPIEVNPRYTASMEVIERAGGQSIVGLHVAACRDRQLPAAEAWPVTPSNWHGKQVVFASQDIQISPAHADRLESLNEGVAFPTVADLPAAGTSIRQGHPLCTVFGTADTRAELVTLLRELVKEAEG